MYNVCINGLETAFEYNGGFEREDITFFHIKELLNCSNRLALQMFDSAIKSFQLRGRMYSISIQISKETYRHSY